MMNTMINEKLNAEEQVMVTGGRKYPHCNIPEDTRRTLKEATDAVLDFFGDVLVKARAISFTNY